LKKILYISLLDWFFTKQRPQHIAELLSKEYQVKYLCKTSWLNKYNKKHKSDDIIQFEIKVNSNLVINRLKLLPLHRCDLIKSLNRVLFKFYIRIQLFFFKPDFLWLTHPEQYSDIPENFIGKIVYDCMDNYSEFTNVKEKKDKICLLERNLCNRANVIFTSSYGLYNKLAKYTDTKKIRVVKNGTNFELFQEYCSSNKEKQIPIELSKDRKNIGYFGGISTWFDIDLVIEISNRFSELDVVLIGPVNNKELIERAETIENLKILGPRKYYDLPNYLYYFDVCIMPFIVNDLIKDVNPVKLYEYLSMGKPVVAPYYDEIKEFNDVVYLAYNHEDFIGKIESSLSEDSNFNKSHRIKYAKENSWDSRMKVIVEELSLCDSHA